MWNEGSVAARGDVEGLAEGIVIDDVVHVGRSWFRMIPAAATTSGDDALVVRSMPVSKTARLGEIVALPPDDMTARSLFESAFDSSTPNDEADESIVARPRRTVTVSLWGLTILGAALLFTGGALTVMVRPPQAAPMSAPVVTAPAVSAPVAPVPVVAAPAPVSAPVAVPPAAPVVVQQPAVEPAPSSPSSAIEVVAAEPDAPVARPMLVRKAPLPVATPIRRLRPAALPKQDAAATVPDPFAPPPAKKTWVDPFAD